MRNWLLLLLLLAAGANGAEVAFHKHYVDGSYGQVHVLSSQPAGDTNLQTPMICLAPNPMAGRYFRLFMQDLGQDRVMHAPDYPGLGQSDAPPGPLDIAGYADAIAGVMDTLGYGRSGSGAIDVCGYHSGAMIAIELAVRRPDLVRRLILVGIPYYEGEARKAMYDENVVEPRLSEDLDSLRDTWAFTVENRQPGVSLERGIGNFVDIMRQRQRTHYLYHAVFSYAAAEQAARVEQPVLILNTHGGLEAETRELAKYFDDAVLIEIPDLEHGVFDVGAARLSNEVRIRND